MSNALKQGGSQAGCWNTWAPTLVSCLQNNGWTRTSTYGTGSVVVHTDSQGVFHVALSRGDGTCDQHNSNRCSQPCNWGTNYVLAPPGGSQSDAVAAPQSTSNTDGGGSGSDLSTADIVGIVIGCAAAATLIGSAILYFVRPRYANTGARNSLQESLLDDANPHRPSSGMSGIANSGL